jgi:hypothetical protein
MNTPMTDAQLQKYLAKPVIYHQDPGHGWFGVKRAALSALGILEQVSSYSYQRGETVYLEEDCDASLFFKAVRDRLGQNPQYQERHTNKRSPIRSYNCFRGRV